MEKLVSLKGKFGAPMKSTLVAQGLGALAGDSKPFQFGDFVWTVDGGKQAFELTSISVNLFGASGYLVDRGAMSRLPQWK
jgi:hypothetical protein